MIIVACFAQSTCCKTPPNGTRFYFGWKVDYRRYDGRSDRASACRERRGLMMRLQRLTTDNHIMEYHQWGGLLAIVHMAVTDPTGAPL